MKIYNLINESFTTAKEIFGCVGSADEVQQYIV